MRHRWRWLLLGLLTLFTIGETRRMLSSYFQPDWEKLAFYDLRLWRQAITDLGNGGELYDTSIVEYFEPGSRSYYKYPPTFAALLRPLEGASPAAVGHGFLFANLALVALSAALLFRARPIPRRALLVGVCLFALWRATWETLADLQMETILLVCLSGAAAAFARVPSPIRRDWLAGALLGVAGSFKVYPWLLAFPFLVRRRWHLVLGALTGTMLTFALVTLVLPFRYTTQFFLEILPHIGGTSLSLENLSVTAWLARGVMAVRGTPLVADSLDMMMLEGPEGPGAAARWTATLGSLSLLAALTVGLIRRGRARAASARGDIATLAATTLALVLFIPTSWLSYQTLLLLPWWWMGTRLSEPGARRSEAVLFAGATLPAVLLYAYDPIFLQRPALFAALRTVTPLLLIALLRSQLERSTPEASHEPS